MKCAGLTTTKTGTPKYEEWCRLHETWTFDCLLRLARATAKRKPRKAQGRI